MVDVQVDELDHVIHRCDAIDRVAPQPSDGADVTAAEARRCRILPVVVVTSDRAEMPIDTYRRSLASAERVGDRPFQVCDVATRKERRVTRMAKRIDMRSEERRV